MREFILYEYSIRLEMKDAFFGYHESYRFPFPPFVLHLSPVLQDAGFRGISGLLGFEKKKKKKKKKKRSKVQSGHLTLVRTAVFQTTKGAVCFA